jgi:hypothetical protein
MPESRTYKLGTLTLDRVGQEVETFLRRDQGLVVEGVRGPGGYLVQARLNGQEWRKFVGLDKAVQVQIVPGEGDNITVTAGQGKWIDKLGVGAVGMLWFFPLAIVSGIGALGQVKLVGDIFDRVQNLIIRGE